MILDKRLIISIIEAIYVIYMFKYYKTTYSFNLLPLKFLDNSLYLKHQKYATDVPESHICPFGHDMSFVIAAFLILRNFIPCLMEYNICILAIISIGCFMNINAVVYFLPVIITEIALHFLKLKK
jgi:hypothetical protein